MQRFSESESDAETGAHESGEQSDEDAFREVEVLDGFLLLFVAQFGRFQTPRIPNDVDTDQGYNEFVAGEKAAAGEAADRKNTKNRRISVKKQKANLLDLLDAI